MERTLHSRVRPATGVLFATALALSVVPGCRTTEGGALVRTSDGFRLTESGSVGLGDRAHFREATASLEADALAIESTGADEASLAETTDATLSGPAAIAPAADIEEVAP